MSALVLRPDRSGPLFGDRVAEPRGEAMPRSQNDDPCGGERVIAFALCLIVAASVVSLLLLAL